ncbi:MAG: hypothetical protein QOJ00_212 [Actinomycetota bacterium]
MNAAHRAVLACALVLALVGAGGAVQKNREDNAPAVAAVPPSPVKLLDAGAGPKLLLRLSPTVGSDNRTTQHQEQAIRITVNGQTISVAPPALELDVRTHVDSVRGHRIRTTSTYDAARVLDAPGTNPDTKAAMSKMVGSLVGQSVTCERTDAAVLIRCSRFHITFPDEIKALADTLTKGLENEQPALAMPFPDEPVGVGAHWTFSPKATLVGLRSEAQTEVTITAINGRRVEAKLTQTVHFVPGVAKVSGVDATVESGELAGGGTVTWNLDSVDALMSATIEGTSVMTAGTGNASQRIEQFQHQSFRVTQRA